MKNALPVFARFILLVERSEAENLADARKLVGQSIIELERSYDKYLFEGFPMFPWEAAINSWFLTDKSIANGPLAACRVTSICRHQRARCQRHGW